MIDEALVRELLYTADDDAVLVLVEGQARVVSHTVRGSTEADGAAVLISRTELVEQLGTDAPNAESVARAAATLRDAADKLGA
ncbi:hypothetical protein AB0I94_33670 [Streptomyces sp. NPDC050147]|uniref:hypothetical protein n=1 Tax=Streptomyces sp. NPDC050147 TaxID=3155513 RepID=UPI003440349F